MREVMRNEILTSDETAIGAPEKQVKSGDNVIWEPADVRRFEVVGRLISVDVHAEYAEIERWPGSSAALVPCEVVRVSLGDGQLRRLPHVGDRVYMFRGVEDAPAGWYVLQAARTYTGMIDSTDAMVTLCREANAPGDYIETLASYIGLHEHDRCREELARCREEELAMDKLAEAYGVSIPEDWIGEVQVQPCETYVVDGETHVGPAASDEAPQFWGVYARRADGRAEWLKDLENEGDALALKATLESAFAKQYLPGVSSKAVVPLVDGVPVEAGQVLSHSSFGEVQVAYSELNGWHYARWGYAGFGKDFNNLSNQGAQILIEPQGADRLNEQALVSASEFAKTHGCDPDWIAAMGDRKVLVLQPGQRGTYSGFEATILSHYWNGMYNVAVPGGRTCVSGTEFIPDDYPLAGNPRESIVSDLNAIKSNASTFHPGFHHQDEHKGVATRTAADDLTIAYMAAGFAEFCRNYRDANGQSADFGEGQLAGMSIVISHALLADQVADYFDEIGEHPGVFVYEVAEPFGMELASLASQGVSLTDGVARSALNRIMLAADYSDDDLREAFKAATIASKSASAASTQAVDVGAAIDRETAPNRKPEEVEVFQGYFGHEGTILKVEFQTYAGAADLEKDAAFLAALAQVADIDYQAIGKCGLIGERGDCPSSEGEIDSPSPM